MKKVGRAIFILLGLAILWIVFVNFVLQDSSPSYRGGYVSDGSYCDYGYKQGNGICCDEDDYSCEVCDLHGIYCDTDEVFQGEYSDIEHVPDLTPNGDYDCVSFSSWEQAQKVYIREGGPKKDPYTLDLDEDGSACEALREE